MRSVKRLYREFQPDRYELYLEPDREKMAFSGRVKITGRKVGRPSKRLTFHQKELKITSAKIIRSDKKLGEQVIAISRHNTHKSYDELRLHSEETIFPGEYTVVIEFSGKITEPMHGIYPCNFEHKGQKKQLIATQFESHHAREAFPCIDEPEAKAVFSLSLKTPKAETVIANTPAKNSRVQGDSVLTEFEDTPIMSAYLLAFVYGEMGFKETKSKNGVALRVYATPDNVSLSEFALKTATGCLDFFEEYFGVPYPLPKLDLVGLPDFSAAAMENWGLMTFRDQVLFVDPDSTSIETKQLVAMVIAHEISHQWFGDLVTMKWWNDLWLNESFANLMEYRALEPLFPEWDVWQIFVQREITSALSRDALPNVQPVQVEVRHPDELAAVFDPSIVYAKGGSLLNMVRNLIGEDDFRAGLKAYFEEFKYRNTVADDLWHHLESASGRKITKIMQDWLSRPGFPVVEVDHQPGSQEFTARQERLTIGGVHPAQPWNVPLAASLPTDEAIFSQREKNFRILKSSDYPLTLNHDGHSYLVTQYLNDRHFQSILDAVKQGRLSTIDRLLLVQNHLLLERAGRVSTLKNIQLLPAYSDERSETVWAMLSGIIGNIRNLVDKDSELESKINSFVREQVKDLVADVGWQGKDSSEPVQMLKLRSLALGLAAAAEDKAVVDKGLELFGGFEKPSDLAADIRTVVYFIGARYGSDKDFEKLVSLHNSLTNADEKDEVAAEICGTRDNGNLKSLLSMMTGPSVRLQDAPTWFALLMRNRYATDMAWDWLEANWRWVEEKYGGDKSMDRFPRYAGMVFSKPEQLKRYKAFFGPKKSVAMTLPIELGVEEIEGRIAWRAANEQPVKDWLAGL